MPTRREVYNVIDGERDYQDSLRRSTATDESVYANIQPVLSNEIGIVKVLADQALVAISMGKGPHGSGSRNGLNEGEDSRDALRKLIAVAVRALETHGCPPRNLPEGPKPSGRTVSIQGSANNSIINTGNDNNIFSDLFKRNRRDRRI